MTQQDMKEQYTKLYNYMAESNVTRYMKTFGNAMTEMMDWFIANKPDMAQEWLDKLGSIKWRNYLTTKEAERITGAMEPKAPWSRDQWRSAMEQHRFETENSPYYNSCALYTVMSMIYSDSIDTLNKYIGEGDVFALIYDLATDKLTDADKVFNVRTYFGV